MATRDIYAAVIGGGASGLMCAIRAARRYKDKKIVIIEAADRVGKKLLVTGNGRCNLTNLSAAPVSYHGDGAGELINILFEKYNPGYVIDFFKSLGLFSYADGEGRVYPRSNLASSVLDVLRLELRRLGVDEICGCTVTDIRRAGKGFELITSGGRIIARRVVISVGGSADYAGRPSPSAALSDRLGLPRSSFAPALCPVKVDSDVIKPLKGVRVNSAVSLIHKGKTIRSERGELQFADGALSGICVFDLSRYANTLTNCRLSVDLLPELDREQTGSELRRIISTRGNCPASELFVGLFHKNIAQAILKQCGVAQAELCKDISDREIKSLVDHMKDWRFSVIPRRDLRNAQVTAGGILLSAVDPHTLESKRHKGVYITGEALDVDGDCGGYNLQFAWASGMLAGDSL